MIIEKHVLIVENQTDALKRNESAQSSSKFLLSGPFTEFDIENRNKRFYTAKNFIPCMNALLEKRKLLGVLYGEFDHPDVFDIAGKNTSHAIESLVHNESSNRVDGSIALLSTHYGKEARAIINDGYPLFVSSRAAGITDGSGNVALKELFTYDIVLDPGFASARVSVNESFGLKTNDDVPYRIYEMKDEHVNNLFLDNKNDNKTRMDLTEMKIMLADEMAKLEHQILTKVTEGKSAPEEVKALMAKYENVNDEMIAVKEYLTYLKTKVAFLVSENTKLSGDNKKLVFEINENTAYANHLASQLKNLNKYTVGIESRLAVDEKMIEYVAEHAKANILFSEDIANNVTKITETVANNAAFLEYVATEGDITQKFVEHVAAETEIAQKFAENTASEVKDTQGFLEYVATEKYKDEVFLEYVANKVDGIIGYNVKAINKIKSSIPLKEGISDEDDIHTLEPIQDFLGLEQEQEVANNIENAEVAEVSPVVSQTEVSPVDIDLNVNPTDLPSAIAITDPGVAVEAGADTDNVVEPSVVTDIQLDTIQPVQAEDVVEPVQVEDVVEPVQAEDVVEPVQAEEVVQPENNDESPLLNALVKITGTDETGIVVNADGDKVTIQKSGSDETQELEVGEYEVINTDENIAEKVGNVLAEIKKNKILANQQPHFYTFLTEAQISDFKVLDTKSREAITLAMNESEYYNTADVLNIIGKTLNEKAMSYEDKLVTNVPTLLKETWNGFSKEQKLSVITEAKYFNLVTTADITNFWNTRPFAKAVLSPEAIMIKESASTETESLTDDYVNSFLKSMDNLNTK